MNEELVLEPVNEPMDAVVKVQVEGDQMTALLQIFPPENGGKDVTREMIEEKLAENNIVYGINEKLIEEIVAGKYYNKLFIIAEGKRPIDGQDGIITEFFPRDQQYKLHEREDGSIDFKNINLFTPVEKGTVICEITPPVPPVEGINVFGNPVYGRPGKVIYPPKGEGTVLNEDGTKLVAARAGNLVFQKDRFIVEEVLRIGGNVDHSVGNIDFLGEVIVEGDLREGFSIKAKGNVTVKGVVEGATIESGGDVILMKGVTGMNKAVITAKKDLKSTFLENCKAYAKGSIIVESIINSHVVAGDKIEVNGKKGVIVGGSAMALNTISARTIGSRASIPTTIILGATQEIIHERNELEKTLQELKQRLQEINQNIKYLEILEKSGKITTERKELLKQLKIEKPRNQMKQSYLNKQIEDINKKIENVDACRVICKQIYPAVKVTIGNTFINITSLYENCVLYYKDSTIKISQR